MDESNAPATKADLSAARQELKGEISALRQELKGDISAARQELKEEISGVRQELKGEISGVKQDVEMLRSEMHHQYRDLVEQMRDGQTELLKAFYNFATATNQKTTLLETNEAALRGRLSALETRMLEVEKRLNMPPAA